MLLEELLCSVAGVGEDSGGTEAPSSQGSQGGPHITPRPQLAGHSLSPQLRVGSWGPRKPVEMSELYTAVLEELKALRILRSPSLRKYQEGCHSFMC